MHKESAYYVLVLSRQKARLIEAYNDKAIRELKGDFPVDDYLYATDSQKLSNKKGQDNLIEEFFNKVDKTLLKNIKNNIHPVVIATEERNFHHYLKMADKKDLIIGNINRFKEDESPENIAKAAWPKVLDILKKRNQDRINELDTAVGQGKFLSDYNDIWNAIRQGKGKTLFVKKDFYQAAVIEEDKIIPVNGNGEIKNGHIDDIIDEMIEQNLSFGGDTVFLEGDEIEKFQNVALVTRY